MSDKDAAMRQAIEVLEDLTNGHESDPALFKDEIAAITALRAALDAQEPTRKAATVEEVNLAYYNWGYNGWGHNGWIATFREGFRAAERFHGIKEDET